MVITCETAGSFGIDVAVTIRDFESFIISIY